MSTLAKKLEVYESVAVEVSFKDDMICLTLTDGREVRTPLEFYPRLAKANKKQLEKFRFIAGGTGIHWEDLDEDLSVESIVLGHRANNF
ncbi:MAG: DUF2442 domain-containing protein [Deltaproteobacteria bacterium]|nr:DUF2442 domain-containing protein [Deltaproteobacteria bacterium]